MNGKFNTNIKSPGKGAVTNQSSIDLLRTMLKEAESGRLRSVSIAATFDNGSVTQAAAYDSASDVLRLLAGTELVKSRLVEEITLSA